MTRLEILSDPICPWCYIGATNLMRAMEARADHGLAVSWRPYFLNPDMPPGGMERTDYLEAKFGGKDAAVKAYMPVQAAAEAAGLSLDFRAIARTPNTLDAQRVIHWAGTEGAQTRVAMALFKAYFEKGADLEDPETLARIAGEAGCDAGVIGRLLAGDADRAEIRAAAAEAARMGVTGVPTFILGGHYVVPGAQPSDLWTKVIDELAAAAAGS
ncbi:DsbA family oxidoreductase [Rhodobacteraceae bacterium DSL-40]|uniref:DsbA family oxidoreductase n=1 Tax=Amaricoccus sp. B4 TaxID=3368557 RepID=UPI000DAE00FB